MQKGTAEIVFHDPERKLVVFSRKFKEQEVWVILNRSEQMQQVDFTQWSNEQEIKDLLSGATLVASRLQVPAVSGLILK